MNMRISDHTQGRLLVTEADAGRELIVPHLREAGWFDSPSMIGEQHSFTDGRLILSGESVRRGPRRQVDYLLYYRRDLPLAVVEAKRVSVSAETGVQQAREYAEALGLKFAYATNGRRIIEIDYLTGTEQEVERYATPDELWQRLSAATALPAKARQPLLEPFNLSSRKVPRYYQRITIERVIEAILSGRTRILATLATGTGKTCVAFQICWKLWSSRWNRAGEHRRPKILFLADRNLLVDDPMAKMFAPFGDARHKITSDDVSQGRDIYFGIYQAMTTPNTDVFRQYSPDFFDLIIIDECHRGAARDDSSWRAVLDYFSSAVQFGMTATPQREESRDTYDYFGNPVYTYSLKQGIEDGFLAPYRVHRVITNVDAAGWRPTQGQLDRYGREIPDGEYQTKDFERVVALRSRTQAIAAHLTRYMKGTDRFAKTIVFCVDQDHAAEMRQELHNLNRDITALPDHEDYVCRVTSDEGQIGKLHLAHFQDVDRRTPVILTTSQLLTTGVDAEMVKNVVLARVIGGRAEFKQIIGRGTRLNTAHGKTYFSIIDFTGTATAHFADPDFDGEPALIEEVTVDEAGNVVDESGTPTVEVDSDANTPSVETAETDSTGTLMTGTPEAPYEVEPTPDTFSHGGDAGEHNTVIKDPPPEDGLPRKLYVDGGEVEIIGHLIHELDADGSKLRVVNYTEFSGRAVRAMYPNREALHAAWAHSDTRQEAVQALAASGVSFEELAASAGQPDADPFDLLCHLAWNAPLLTRRQRAEQARRTAQDLFTQHGDTAREVLSLLLDRYVERGILQFGALSELMKVQPFDRFGTPTEIARAHFGGVQQLKSAVSRLQAAIYLQ
jgi:type I restriction enzyme, R subunit